MDLKQQEIFIENFHELCKTINKNNNEELLISFFESLLSPSEIVDISKRWLLVKELDEGIVQRDISTKYNVSLCKISRGMKELKKENSAFKTMLEISKTLSKDE